MVYLFVGQDSLSKDIKLKQLKQEFLAPEVEQFNLDILYAKDLTLSILQERLLVLPAQSKKRLVVIKDASRLKENIREFISQYVKKDHLGVILVLDTEHYDPRDEFLSRISRHAQLCRFKEAPLPDAFVLGRSIEQGRADYSLRLLHQLLENGEKPERILGGLRYVWIKDSPADQHTRKRLRLLLNCDMDIKTGRLKPSFALEKLVVSICLSKRP